MDIGDMRGVLRARRVLVGVLLVLVVGGCTAVWYRVHEQYESQAAMVVLAPTRPVVVGAKADENPTAINPFLSFGGSQETAAQVLQVRMADEAVGRRLGDAGVHGAWTFEIKGGSGPLIQVTSTEPTPEQARASAQAILDAATDQLTTLQREAGAPENQLIKTSVVNTPSAPEPVADAKVRMTMLAAVAGAGLVIGLPLWLESRARARRRRAAAAAPTDGVELELLVELEGVGDR